jgi:hypothetical protein
LLIGSVAGLGIELLCWLLAPQWINGLGIMLAAAGLVLGACAGRLLRRPWQEAAAAIDDRYGLKDRAVTALDFCSKPPATPVHTLAYHDALDHLSQVKAQEVVPWRAPRVLPYSLATFAAVVAVMIVAGLNQPAVAVAPEISPVVVAQADRAAEELEALEEFAATEKDPELEKLVNELKAAIEEMKEPGTDLRDALATLSEMQAALQAEQAKQNATSADAQMQAVGEALALAQPLAEAGQALASGDYEKAAEQLAKLEAPELDRQTEKAVKEKLEQAAKQGSSESQNSLNEAIGEMSQGLGGEGRKFRDGSQKLAGEAKKQAKRKKLTDLLQKQCNCLGECKGECEGECQSLAKGKGGAKGGKKWGLGSSDGELGERTGMLGSTKQEKITGKQSDEGEIEVETTHSPEGSQEAQREYRAQYAKYKEISESVLDNEPIPLGHRQTIRRYFESIRPSDAETDAVGKSTTP